MSRGKNLSLEEARKAKQLEQFAKEHQSQETEPGRFDALMNAMTAGEKSDKK